MVLSIFRYWTYDTVAYFASYVVVAQLSVGPIVCGPSCLWVQLSWAQLSWAQLSVGSIVGVQLSGPNCPGPNCRSTVPTCSDLSSYMLTDSEIWISEKGAALPLLLQEKRAALLVAHSCPPLNICWNLYEIVYTYISWHWGKNIAR